MIYPFNQYCNISLIDFIFDSFSVKKDGGSSWHPDRLDVPLLGVEDTEVDRFTIQPNLSMVPISLFIPKECILAIMLVLASGYNS